MCMPTVDPPTQKAASYVTVIRVMIVLQVVVAILGIVADEFFLANGIFGILLAFCLFMLQKVLNHNIALPVILVSLYFSLDFLFAILTFPQNGINLITTTNALKFDFAVFIVCFIYYIFASIFLYYPYKQFKTIRYKQNPAYNYIFSSKSDGELIKESQEIKEVQYQPAYGDINVNPRKRNNDNGVFQVSKGQGIKL